MEEAKQTPSSQSWIAIGSPSRGLTFSEHEEYIENVRDTYPNIRVFRTHNLPIPENFNNIAEKFLANPKFEYLWWIEDDVLPPDRTLDAMLDAIKKYDIVAMDYGFNGGYNTIVKSEVTGEILFTGFGCTMMRRNVLEAFDKPIFRADKAFNISNLSWYDTDPNKVYGMYDVLFGSQARSKGFTFGQIPGECRHLQLIRLGEIGVNNGIHQIGEKDRISKHLTLPLENL